MLRPHRSYDVDDGDYNDIVFPSSKRRKICIVEGASLDNPNGAGANELHTENQVSAGNSLPEFDAQATKAGDGLESGGNWQKMCIGMVSSYLS